VHEDRDQENEDDSDDGRNVKKPREVTEQRNQAGPEREHRDRERHRKPQDGILLSQMSFSNELDGEKKKDDGKKTDQQLALSHGVLLKLSE
jgi:hypothetical protein